MRLFLGAILCCLSLAAFGLNEEACRLYYRRLAQGEAGAFNDLVGSIDRDLRGFIYKRVRDGEAVEDIAQEVYTVVWKASSLPREDLRASDWILAIAKNKIRQHFERQRKQPPVVNPERLAETASRESNEVGDGTHGYSHLEHELNVALKSFLFSEQNRKLLQLSAEGMTYPKMIQTLGLDLSPSGVMARLAALKKTLDEAIRRLPEVLDRLLTSDEKALFLSAMAGTAPRDSDTDARVLALQDTVTRHLAAFGVEGGDKLPAADRDWLAAQTLDPEQREIVALTEAGVSSPEIVRRLKLAVGDTGVQARYQRALDLLELATNEAARVSRENLTERERELLRLAAEGFSPHHIQFRLGLKSSPAVIADSITALRAKQRELFERPGAVAVDRRTFAARKDGEVVETGNGRGLQQRLEKSLGNPRAAFLRYLEAGYSYDDAKAITGIGTNTKALTKTVNNWRTQMRGYLESNRELGNGPLDRLSAEDREFLKLAQDGGEKAVRAFYKTPWTNLYVWNRAYEIREKLRN